MNPLAPEFVPGGSYQQRPSVIASWRHDPYTYSSPLTNTTPPAPRTNDRHKHLLFFVDAETGAVEPTTIERLMQNDVLRDQPYMQIESYHYVEEMWVPLSSSSKEEEQQRHEVVTQMRYMGRTSTFLPLASQHFRV
eukprot:PhM_4_TR12014/c0_g1_i1/m.105251